MRSHFLFCLLMTAPVAAAYASPQRSKRDAQITQSVQELIASKPEYANVTCDVDDAIVMLSGNVKLLTERRALERSVKGIKHVAHVEDHVILVPPNVSDEKLRAGVRERLASSGFGHLRFNAHEGWVAVEGSVKDQQERSRLMDMIWSTPGVKEADFQKLHARER